MLTRNQFLKRFAVGALTAPLLVSGAVAGKKDSKTNKSITYPVFLPDCIMCGACIEYCPEGALSDDDGSANIPILDTEKCIGCDACGLCEDVCPVDAVTCG